MKRIEVRTAKPPIVTTHLAVHYECDVGDCKYTANDDYTISLHDRETHHTREPVNGEWYYLLRNADEFQQFLVNAAAECKKCANWIGPGWYRECFDGHDDGPGRGDISCLRVRQAEEEKRTAQKLIDNLSELPKLTS